MANTIQKKMRTITITTNHGDTFEIADTEECMSASMALAAFNQGGTLYFQVAGEGEGEYFDYYVPASSVDSIRVETSSVEVEVPDPVCMAN